MENYNVWLEEDRNKKVSCVQKLEELLLQQWFYNKVQCNPYESPNEVH